MTVRELMEKLAQMDPDMEVITVDTYCESEGYGDVEPICTVYDAVVDEKGRCYLCAE